MTYAAACAWQAGIALRRGDITVAEREAHAAADLATEHNLRLIAPYAQAHLGEALLERGDLADAHHVLIGTEHTATRGSRPDIPLLHARARLWLARGDRDHAITDLRTCGATMNALGIVNPNVLPWRSTLALALPDSANGEARDLVDAELDQARRIGQPHALGVALRCRALLHRGADRIAQLEQAITEFRKTPSQLELATALSDLGAAFRRANQRRVAREPLREAIELAHQCGATATEDRARKELTQTGARRLQPPGRHGADTLTPTEQLIAKLAVDGLSNPEIAQAQFISLKTVETHLRHIYRKLHITSRRELKHALATSQTRRPR